MTDPQPQDPRAYQAWLQQLEQQWQAGLIPDPQAVAVIVLNHHGEVLLQLRDNNPHIAFANCWTLPGGVVEANETPEQAAQRELAEETGLSLDVSLWKMYRRESKKYTFLIEQYVYISHTLYSVNQMILGEGQALHFFSQHDLPMLSIAYGFEVLLQAFFSSREQTNTTYLDGKHTGIFRMGTEC